MPFVSLVTRQARTGVRVMIAVMTVSALLYPARLQAHIELETSAPSHGAILETLPTRLMLRFSAHIEARYTNLMLVLPSGDRVPLEDFVFVPGSDRELTVPMPAGPAGRYRVVWRTAGADGHVLQGSFSFTVASSAAAPDTAAPMADAAGTHVHEHELADSAPHSAVTPADVLARTLHFAALFLLLGALTTRMLLLRRLRLADDVRALLLQRVWRAVAVSALVLTLVALLRLWLQSVALHGSDRAWSAPLLSIMLTDTSWGRAWLVQLVLLALLAASLVSARPPRDRMALGVALIASVMLSAIPALTGHAAGAERAVALTVMNDALHVLAAGAWLGTLLVLMIYALPLMHGRPGNPALAAAAIDAFSPVALGAAAIVSITGAMNALLHFDAASQLWSTSYGRVLLVKLTLVFGILLAGAYNWRVVRPRLRASDDVSRLRRSAAAELALALAIVIVTAVLTGLPRP